MMAGFEYLYLTKADYEKLPAGTVEARDELPERGMWGPS